MPRNQALFCRLSLAFLWTFTGLTSAFFAREIGYEILAKAGIKGHFADICLYSGATLDGVLGLWLLTGRALKLCYITQIATIVFYTALLTILAPAYWLHPFGPVTKNVPILALIYVLWNETKPENGKRRPAAISLVARSSRHPFRGV